MQFHYKMKMCVQGHYGESKKGKKKTRNFFCDRPGLSCQPCPKWLYDLLLVVQCMNLLNLKPSILLSLSISRCLSRTFRAESHDNAFILEQIPSTELLAASVRWGWHCRFKWANLSCKTIKNTISQFTFTEERTHLPCQELNPINSALSPLGTIHLFIWMVFHAMHKNNTLIHHWQTLLWMALGFHSLSSVS